jgi:hypothetical protein
MAIDMSQFYQVFFDESAEHLAAMEGLLLDLDVENPDSEQLNAIFRRALDQGQRRYVLVPRSCRHHIFWKTCSIDTQAGAWPARRDGRCLS